MRMTDEEVMSALRTDSPLNKARSIFSAQAAGLEQANLQRVTPTPIEGRRMEFEAVRKIAAVLGVEL